MAKLRGNCHCGNIEITLRLSKDASDYAPRKCDCSFCMKQGAAYVSDPAGSIRYRFKQEPKRYRQFPESEAEFLICNGCGVLVGVVYSENMQTFSAANASAFQPSPFGAPVIVSPHKLSAGEKSQRWASVWFADVAIALETNP